MPGVGVAASSNQSGSWVKPPDVPRSDQNSGHSGDKEKPKKKRAKENPPGGPLALKTLEMEMVQNHQMMKRA